MGTVLDIHVSQDGSDKMAVKLIGELDQISLRSLKQELASSGAETKQLLIFDLEEVDFIASAGLAIFVWYANIFKKRGFGQKLKVINCSEGVFRVFHLTMLNEMFEVSCLDDKEES